MSLPQFPTPGGLIVAPLPGWASDEPWARPPLGVGSRASDGRVLWLEDTQLNIVEAEHHWLWRRAQEVVTPDGLQAASTLDIVFEPSFERPEVHYVRVIRGGEVRDALRLEAFQMLRRERDLERGIYSGELTAHLVIPDVRVGDVVETAYSVKGRHPVLGEYFGAAVILQYAAPVHDVRFRLLARAEREVSVRTWGEPPAALETAGDGLIDRRWRTLDAQPLQDEPDCPAWWRSWASLRIGDRMSWSQVADVFRPLYEDGEALPPDLEAAASAIEVENASTADRAAEALRWVQRATRYIASGIGERGLAPQSLEEVLASRSGDCKDASRLLTALLRRLGVTADPALVNTTADPDLPQHPAYLLAFNHCVVRAQVDGEVYWLDPTRAPQGGRLDRLDQARFAWALPLVDAAGLQSMGEDALQTLVETREDWSFGSRPSSPARLKVRTISRGWKADELRTWIANNAETVVAQRWREYYEREYGAVEALEAPLVDDDFAANEVTSTELYEVQRPWTLSDDGKLAVWSHADDIVGPNLRTPETPRRRDPIDLGAPRRFQTIRLVNLPQEIAIQPWDDRLEGPGVLGRMVLTRLGRENLDPPRLREEMEISFQQRTVMPRDAEDYFAWSRQMREKNGLTLRLPVRGDRFGASRWTLMRAVAIAIGIYLLVQIAVRLLSMSAP